MKSPTTWMPLDIGAYLADTMELAPDEHGCYLLIIMHYWKNRGPINVDRLSFQRITKCDNRNVKKLYDCVSRFFTIENGVWRHGRIDAELDKALGNKEKKSSQTQAAREALAAKRASVTDEKQTLLTDTVTDLRAGTSSPLPLKKETSSLPPSREDETNPRSRGTNPRVMGTNPRATGDNPRAREVEVLKNVEKGKAAFDINRVLSDEGRQSARKEAPGWDIYHLASVFNENVNSGNLRRPDYPDRAFPAWCKTYTKGNPP